VKNHNLGFTIPYTINGQPKNYIPDFVVHVEDGRGRDDPQQLIVEVSGQPNKKKEAKASTAEALWVPAVNNAGAWGRWRFLEIKDPWDAANGIRSRFKEPASSEVATP
jgi:type III restriction enzyme